MANLNIEYLVFNTASWIRKIANTLIENNKKNFTVTEIPKEDYENMVDELYEIAEKNNKIDDDTTFRYLSKILDKYAIVKSENNRIHINKGYSK